MLPLTSSPKYSQNSIVTSAQQIFMRRIKDEHVSSYRLGARIHTTIYPLLPFCAATNINKATDKRALCRKNFFSRFKGVKILDAIHFRK